ncbi:MAG: aldehyde dehydrogenase family protein, partial [Solirubrobacteraceae bacterium]
MATIEQPQATETIDVENPATGQVIRSVPATSADELQAMVERARAAQVGWEALGFEGRGRVLRRMQKWVVDNHDR